MNTDNKTKNYILGAILTIIILLLGSIVFIYQSQKALYEEKITYLEEITLKSAQNINQQISGDIKTLEALVTALEAKGNFNVTDVMPMLKLEADKNYFKRMGIILADGAAYTTDNAVANFSNREYFKEAMKGNSSVSDMLTDITDGEDINVMAAPIQEDGAIVGVIFATKKQEYFNKSMKTSAFNSKGYSYVITSEGVPVIKTNHPSSIGEYQNFFEKMKEIGIEDKITYKLQRDIKDGKNGTFFYNRGNRKKELCYTKVGINDWYILSVIDSKVISSKSDHLIAQMVGIAVVLISMTILICFLLLNGTKKHRHTLEKMAYRDPITGYGNHAKFSLDSKRLLNDNKHLNYVMIEFDINKFKLINDIYGTKRGDEILTKICEVLNELINDNESFSRTSADIFNILMVDKGNTNTLLRIKELQHKIETPIDDYKIKMSFGIYPIINRHLDINVYCDRANLSKQIARESKSVNYHFFKDENRLELINEKEMEDVFESALINHEFKLFLQPKYSLKTERIAGAEALVRWQRSKDKYIQPNEFIPLFEKNGFITKLDYYMFENVCQMIQNWKKTIKAEDIPRISVNISRVHLNSKELPIKLLEIAAKYQINPNEIEIELTESVMITAEDQVLGMLHQIKNAGFLLSIDDFGRGYSSLSSLSDIPADFVKIDKVFLDHSIENERGRIILLNIIKMIKDLDLISIAEGVETEEQIDLLKDAGCDYVQGFYFSKAIPIKAFKDLLKKTNGLL
ncbi:MAG: GGDEF domain-containing protein [Erysipelotrichaceae bacterium]